MTRHTLAVDGLHCGGCVNTVRDALLAIEGVQSVEVTLGSAAPSEVVLDAVRDVSTDEVQAALSGGGAFQLVS
jgi:copper chaperone